MSRLKQYLSMETATEVDIDISVNAGEVELDIEVPEVEPVTEAEVYEADAVLAEAPNEVADVVSESEAVISEAEDKIASLENLQEVLQHGLETQQFSPQFAAIVHTSLEEYRELFDDQLTIASLEDFGHDNIEQYYTESLEAIGDIVKGLKNAVVAARTRVSRFLELIGSEDSRVRALNKKADAILDMLSKTKTDGPVEVSLAGVSKRLNFNGAFPRNLHEAINKDIRSRVFLRKQFAKDMDDYFKKVASGIGQVLMTDDAGDVDSIVADIIKSRHPAAAIPSEIASGNGVLGIKLETELESLPEDPERALKVMAQRGVGFHIVETKTESAPDTIELSKGDVVKLAQMVKQYAALYKNVTKTFDTVVKQIRDVESAVSKIRFQVKRGPTQRLVNYAMRVAYDRAATDHDLDVQMVRMAYAIAQLSERAAKKLAKSE